MKEEETLESMTESELNKQLERRLGESDEEYEHRTDFLLDDYYSKYTT
jgi:hypothetical protein